MGDCAGLGAEYRMSGATFWLLACCGLWLFGTLVVLAAIVESGRHSHTEEDYDRLHRLL